MYAPEHWCYLRLATKMLARIENAVRLRFQANGLIALSTVLLHDELERFQVELEPKDATMRTPILGGIAQSPLLKTL